jgi:cell division protein FtsW
MATHVETRTRAPAVSAKGYDWGLLTIIISLLALGLVMVFSSSYVPGVQVYDDPFYFAFRQALWSVLGIAALAVGARIPYTLWERWSVVLMGVALLALLAVIAFGTNKWGATRTFFSGSVQPSEPAKIIIIMYISTWLASKGDRIRDVRVGLVPFSILLGFITVLIVFQPDISTALLIVVTALIMFFIAGADLKQLVLIGLGTAVTFWLIVENSTYAGARIARYLNSVENPLQSTEWQVRHSVEALTRGGPLGVGVGNSAGRVPLGWSDNIFAIIGEEMGLMGTLLVILLFALFAHRGLRTALRAPDTFGMLLATGITTLLILQAILNTAVIVAAVPPTGVTLPFISYGGSSLVTTLGAAGILLSIGRFGGEEQKTSRRSQKGAKSESSKRTSSSSNSSTNSGKSTYHARFDFGRRNRRSRLSRSGRRSTTQRDATRQRTTARGSNRSGK